LTKRSFDLRIPPLGAFFPPFFLLAVSLLLLSGCASKPISRKTQLAITSDIISTADRVMAHHAKIGVSSESVSSPAAASGAPPAAADIYISILPGDAGTQAALKQALFETARRHSLTIAENSTLAGVRYDFFYHGDRSHAVYVTSEPAPRAVSRSTAPRPGLSRLAIIIDDLGDDRAAAKAVLALEFPLTLSVLPHQPYSSEIAEEAARRGDQVLLHLPMESQDPRARPETVELRRGMSQKQVEMALSGMLATVPHAVGVNNHEGSRATADPVLMGALMPALRQRGLFFIDSRTTAATVAYDIAKHSGVRSASRKVFLDDTPSLNYIESQIELAGRDAIRDGSAVAIGHPRPATIAALAEAVPRLQPRAIQLVFASDLAR
jgi:uncharacterized protein